MSTDVSQVGVTLFPGDSMPMLSNNPYLIYHFLSFHLSRFSFYCNRCMYCVLAGIIWAERPPTSDRDSQRCEVWRTEGPGEVHVPRGSDNEQRLTARLLEDSRDSAHSRPHQQDDARLHKQGELSCHAVLSPTLPAPNVMFSMWGN